MPELPAVERARKVIHDNLVGKTITEVETVVDEIVYQGCTNVEFAEKLTGTKLVDTGRKGKIFYLVLDRYPVPVLHLGMTGSVRLKGQPGLEYKDFSTAGDEWPPKFWKFVLRFDDGSELAFTDIRRLARIRLVDGDPLLHPPISELGFDPLLNMPKLEEFVERVQKRKCPVKALLLDQSFSAGVGNWVADEVLYQARVHPAQNTLSLTEAELSAIHEQLEFVIKTAVALNADHDNFPDDWLFHHRWGNGRLKTREAVMPDGNKIAFETVAGRTTAIVPALQKLHGGSDSTKRKKTAKAKEEKNDNSSESAANDIIDTTQRIRKGTRVQKASAAEVKDESIGSALKTTSKRRRATERGGEPMNVETEAELGPSARANRRAKRATKGDSNAEIAPNQSVPTKRGRGAYKGKDMHKGFINDEASAFGHPIPDMQKVDFEDLPEMAVLVGTRSL